MDAKERFKTECITMGAGEIVKGSFDKNGIMLLPTALASTYYQRVIVPRLPEALKLGFTEAELREFAQAQATLLSDAYHEWHNKEKV